jgi:hypothetical protein
MKALKEKRISLRSLWRRGLVILSLFALVFASCGESDDDGGGGTVTNAKVPFSIEVITDPTANSYMGLDVDLTGLKVLVRYSDGTVDFVTDASKFTTYPAWATGAYDETASSTRKYTPLRDYYLYYVEAGKAFQSRIKIPDVIPIYRDDVLTLIDTYDPVYGGTSGVTGQYYQSNGLQITGPALKMYVDDKPNFGSLTLQADYRKEIAGGGYDNTAGSGVKKDVPVTLENDWRIIPYYNNASKTGRGGLYITIGRNPLPTTPNHELNLASGITGNADPGVTAISPLDEVYHVTGLEIETAPELSPFFYWQADEKDTTSNISPWIARVRDTARLKVTYSNDTTKSFSIPELEYQNTVWLNMTPNELASIIPTNTWLPFDMEGITQTAVVLGTPVANRPFTRLREPQIGFYYRGERAWHPVPVYTSFARLNVEILAGGEQITVDMRKRDNDHYGMSAAEFAKLLKVEAIFTAYSNPELEAPFTITYDDGTASPGNLGVPAHQGRYSMDFGVAKDGASPWGVAGGVKNNATKAVKIYYANLLGSQKPNGASATTPVNAGAAPITSRVRNTSVVVEWTNVPQ